MFAESDRAAEDGRKGARTIAIDAPQDDTGDAGAGAPDGESHQLTRLPVEEAVKRDYLAAARFPSWTMYLARRIHRMPW